jgi:hypothetical protein
MSVKRKQRSPNETAIAMVDTKTKEVYFLGKKDIEKEVKKIHTRLGEILPHITKLGEFGLNEIELNVGIGGGIIVLTVEGGITLRYTLQRSN